MSLAPVTANQWWSSAGTGRWRPAARQKRVGEASPLPQFRHLGRRPLRGDRRRHYSNAGADSVGDFAGQAPTVVGRLMAAKVIRTRATASRTAATGPSP
jgi:hypothetical protein